MKVKFQCTCGRCGLTYLAANKPDTCLGKCGAHYRTHLKTGMAYHGSAEIQRLYCSEKATVAAAFRELKEANEKSFQSAWRMHQVLKGR